MSIEQKIAELMAESQQFEELVEAAPEAEEAAARGDC